MKYCRKQPMCRFHFPLCLVLATTWSTNAMARNDVTGLSLEQLMDVETVEVVSASRFSQTPSEAPSAVSVLTSEDIRAYGWRTLAEALNSVRGFLTTDGHEYTYAAVRGFSAPGDYNTRLLLMIDGIRINGSVYDQAFVDQNLPLDLELVDRIEIVRGPGSMVYGGNAFFGVINIITKSGKSLDGAEISVSAGSHGSRAVQLGYGKQLDTGADLLLSVSGLNSDGQALYFPELGQSGPGTDDENTRRFYARYRQGNLQFTALWGKHEHGRPNGAYGAVFDDPRNRDWDETLLLDTSYKNQLSEHAVLSARFFYGEVNWHGQYVSDYNGPPYDVDVEDAVGRWAGAEAQLRYGGWKRQHLLLGMDYQNNLRQNQFAEDAPPSLRCTASGSASDPCLDDRRNSYRLGFYVQDDVALSEDLNLNLGLRHDQSDNADSQWSPRLGLRWQQDQANSYKFLYGSAFRAPNSYERYYSYPGIGTQVTNPNLKAETIKTYEMIWEHRLDLDTRLSAGVNVNQVKNWIVLIDTALGSQFQNQPEITSRGLDLEYEKSFPRGALLRASYAVQFVPERPNGNLNSPSRHLLKANLSTPLPIPRWKLGLEAQYASGQATPSGHTSGYAIANANLRWQPTGRAGPELAFGVYNLFNQHYSHSYPDDSLYSGIPREAIAQDGRNWQLKLTYRF